MNPYSGAWEEISTPAPASVVVRGRSVSIGQRVRLTPRANADLMDAALADRVATIESIDVTIEGDPHFSVTIDDDPGRDLGTQRYPGHRFFFRADEIELVDAAPNAPASSQPRILIAGIGNIFFGDDGFGVSVARRLGAHGTASNVVVRDFGIRGFDLAYALQDGYDTAILVDAMPRGGEPGSLYVLEPDLHSDAIALGVSVDAHGLDPARVLQLARSIGSLPRRILVIGCEPGTVDESQSLDDSLVALSPPVALAVDEALRLIESLLSDITSSPSQ